MKLQSWARTSAGKVRTQNQDSFYTNDNSGIWLIADGMGGHAGGRFASTTISTELPRFIQQGVNIRDAIFRCHQLLRNYGQNRQNFSDMGSTLILALWNKCLLDIYWVGDSRAYIINDAGIKRLTKDHSVVQHLLDLALIDEKSATNHPDKHVLTQCLGGGKNSKPEVGSVTLPLSSNDLILLCSDGLYTELSDKKIFDVVSTTVDKKKAIEHLIAMAEDNGGNDNISATIICPKNDDLFRHNFSFRKFKALFSRYFKSIAD
jgi:protein phosphatase